MSELATAEEDEAIATLSDYLDGLLPPDRVAIVKEKIANDPLWKQTHDELREVRNNLSGLQKARAPEKFNEDVTATIHKRSAGRFFAKRTLGDRVPLGVLLIIGVIVLVIVGAILWTSSTGSLKRDKHGTEPQGSGAIVPKP